MLENVGTFRVGSLDNYEDVREAVQIMRSGGVVVAQFRSVFGVWVRADDAEAVERAVIGVKERKSKRPMSAMMTSRSFLKLVDVELVHKSLQSLVRDPEDFQRRLGGIAIIGAPISPSVAKNIPDSLLSQKGDHYKMLNLDPTGNPHMSGFIEQLAKSDIPFVGVSSLNSEGESEIYDLEEAIAFVKPKSINLLLTDPLAGREGVRGSFPIVDLESASAIRDGHIPMWLIENVLGVHLDITLMKAAKYGHLADFERRKNLKVSPHEWRNLALKLTESL